jgi:hypothetical protein
MRQRRTIAVLFVALLAICALHRPSADIQLLMHDAADPAPRRVQAAVDLGLVAVKLLVTWSGHLAR